ncbi:hypothetical protein E4U17_006225 [Claviceps sp. LM77 group G4]|nr:hypothetical protein E4U17_006225 [Claviceps sp. LM77 group G4]KAG6056981.1 hypothetical protein E4U33_007580 [Claviceps sp. LM78 group G4]KAG6077806.1 hypothetical protein E4U16_002013 [Claviceps sp. LM84 group G4]
MVWPKDPSTIGRQNPSLCNASWGPPARLQANYSSARPSSVGQPPARSANLNVTTAGPGVPLLLQKLSSLDVGNERRFVSADADNRRYHQKDHFAPQSQPRLPHPARLSPRQDPELTGLPCSTVF